MRQDIKKLVSAAFQIVGDLKETIAVNYLVSAGPYNPTADSMNETLTTVPNVGALFTRFTMEELDSSVIVSTDSKVLIPALSLNGVVPKENDYMINTVTSERFEVIKFRGVPGDSLFIIHVRRR